MLVRLLRLILGLVPILLLVSTFCSGIGLFAALVVIGCLLLVLLRLFGILPVSLLLLVLLIVVGLAVFLLIFVASLLLRLHLGLVRGYELLVVVSQAGEALRDRLKFKILN